MSYGNYRYEKIHYNSLTREIQKEQSKGITHFWIKGRIVESSLDTNRCNAILSIDKILEGNKWVKARGWVWIYLPDGTWLVPSAYYRLSASLNFPRQLKNPGMSKIPSNLEIRGISLIGSVKSSSLIFKERGNPIIELPMRYRKSLYDRLCKDLGKISYLGGALLLGERTEEMEGVKEIYLRSGTFHLIAISGMNVGLWLLILYMILHFFHINPTIRDIACLFAIIFFVVLSGNSPSVLRASLIAVLYLSGQIMCQPRNFFSDLVFSAVLLLLYNPMDIFDAGFQLTYLSTFGLVLFYKHIRYLFPVKGGIFWKGLSGGLGAAIPTFPIVAYRFHRVAFTGIIATLFLAVLITIFLFFGMPYAIGGAYVPLLAKGLASGMKISLYSFEWSARLFSSIPFITYRHPGGFLFLWLIPMLCYLFAFKVKKEPALKVFPQKNHGKGLLLLVAVAVEVILLLPFYPSSSLRSDWKLTVMDVGEASCQMIRIKDGTVLLFDSGGRRGGDFLYERAILQTLLNYRIRKIDGIYLTHWDIDHSGSLPFILRDLKVGAIYFGPGPLRNKIKSEVLNMCSKKGTKIFFLKRGKKVDYGTFNIVCLNPKEGGLLKENDESLVLRINIGKKNILFTGDIESYAENDMLEENILSRVNILIVPHHGSRTSSSMPFLETVRPELSLISVGFNNSFGHPSEEVLSSIKKVHSGILRTDRDGAIEVSGSPFKIKVYNE